MRKDEIEIEILEGGICKITSGKVSMQIHAKIEDAVKRFEEMLGGGDTKVAHLPHHHRDVGTHVHGGAGQQH